MMAFMVRTLSRKLVKGGTDLCEWIIRIRITANLGKFHQSSLVSGVDFMKCVSLWIF